jgi:hypothetical protein
VGKEKPDPGDGRTAWFLLRVERLDTFLDCSWEYFLSNNHRYEWENFKKR